MLSSHAEQRRSLPISRCGPRRAYTLLIFLSLTFIHLSLASYYLECFSAAVCRPQGTATVAELGGCLQYFLAQIHYSIFNKGKALNPSHLLLRNSRNYRSSDFFDIAVNDIYISPTTIQKVL